MKSPAWDGPPGCSRKEEAPPELPRTFAESSLPRGPQVRGPCCRVTVETARKGDKKKEKVGEGSEIPRTPSCAAGIGFAWTNSCCGHILVRKGPRRAVTIFCFFPRLTG